MKKLPILFLSIVLTSAVNAQGYKKFKLGIGLGYASGRAGIGHGYVEGSGGLLTLEPAFRVSDNLAVGLRLEGAAYGSVAVSSMGAYGYGSITINGQYYLNGEKFRPFVGAGFGIYLGEGSLFGFYPRLGFDLGKFTLALDYNIMPKGTEYYDYLTNSNATYSSYYVGVRIGWSFFCAKK